MKKLITLKSSANNIILPVRDQLLIPALGWVAGQRAGARHGALSVSFTVMVILPSMAAFCYFLLWASPQYLSEARIAVRSNSVVGIPIVTATQSSDATVGNAPNIIGNSTVRGAAGITTQDSYIVADYIRSTALIDDLGG